MPPPAKLLLRIGFWAIFLAVAGISARQIWIKLDPLRNHPVLAPWWLKYNYGKLGSAHPAIAVAAWQELENCYLRKWSAYDWVVWRVKQNIWQTDDPPIHFRLRRDGSRYVATRDPPAGECRTVTDALMAMLYQEQGWRQPFTGDWRRWWEANWTAFPNRALPGLPSGPEDPNPRRRR